MGRVVRFLARKLPIGPAARLRRANRNPQAAQENVLRQLVSRAANTEFGRAHDFTGILREPDLVRAYQQRVPLANDQNLRPDLERMLQAEPDVLWPGTCKYGALSGGTTTQGQLFPLSDEALKDGHKFGAAVTAAYLADRGKSDFLRGKVLTLAGSVWSDPRYPHILIGERTGISSYTSLLGKTRRQKWMAAVPKFDPELTWQEKISDIAEQALAHDVRMLACVPVWGLQLLRKVLELSPQRLGRRAQTIGEIWPNFQLVIAGGFPLAPQRQSFEEIIGLENLDMRETYAATQGMIAFQSTGDDPALQLWIQGKMFFEFVPWDQFGSAHPERHTVDTIQRDVDYVPYVTSNSGLWSYCLDDIVRFTGVRPPKLLIVGRTAEILDAGGEAILRAHAQQSLDAACQAANCRVVEYHMAPAVMRTDQTIGHQLLVEFIEPPADLQSFATAFDEGLQAVNPKYRIRRQQRGFLPPEITSIPVGTTMRWLTESRANVRSQSKVPRVRENREIADALLEIAGRATSSVESA